MYMGRRIKKRKTTKKNIKITLIKQQGFFTCNFRTPGGSGEKHAAAGWAKRPTLAVPTHGSPAPPGVGEGPVGRNKDHSRPAQIFMCDFNLWCRGLDYGK